MSNPFSLKHACHGQWIRDKWRDPNSCKKSKTPHNDWSWWLARVHHTKVNGGVLSITFFPLIGRYCYIYEAGLLFFNQLARIKSLNHIWRSKRRLWYFAKYVMRHYYIGRIINLQYTTYLYMGLLFDTPALLKFQDQFKECQKSISFWHILQSPSSFVDKSFDLCI